jgi:hypothetical protein
MVTYNDSECICLDLYKSNQECYFLRKFEYEIKLSSKINGFIC